MLENKYNPKDFEDKLYEEWEKKGYFKPSKVWIKQRKAIVL